MCCKKIKVPVVVLAGLSTLIHFPAFVLNAPILGDHDFINRIDKCSSPLSKHWPVLALVCGIFGFIFSIAFTAVSGARAGKKMSGVPASKAAQDPAVAAAPVVAAAPGPYATPAGQPPYPGAAVAGQPPYPGAAVAGQPPYPGAPVQDPSAYGIYPGTEMSAYAATSAYPTPN